MSTFTEGPWLFNSCTGIIHKDGTKIAGFEPHALLSLEMQANALLIAAAPEMYEFIRCTSQSVNVSTSLRVIAAKLIKKINGQES